MTDSEKISRAVQFATKKHNGQKRIGGEEYITHPITVCEMVKGQGYGIDYQLTALFHDLLEDTDTTEEEILMFSNKKVLTAVKLLTKEKCYDIKNYIERVKSNEIAFVVKCADRLHNLQSALVADEKFKRKYILETAKWYLDFSLDIKKAVKQLAESLDTPILELSFLYTPIESWER